MEDVTAAVQKGNKMLLPLYNLCTSFLVYVFRHFVALEEDVSEVFLVMEFLSRIKMCYDAEVQLFSCSRKCAY